MNLRIKLALLVVMLHFELGNALVKPRFGESSKPTTVTQMRINPDF